jgi:hypothetical protein
MRVRAPLAAEALKAFNRLGFWILLCFFALLLFLVCGSSLYNQVQRDGAHFRLPGAWASIVNATTLLSFFSVVCTVILLTASEWGWRTGRQNFIDGLSRAEFFAGKVLLVAMVAAAYWVAAVGVGGVLALMGTAASPGTEALVRAADVQMLAGLLLFLFLAGAMALPFGMAAAGTGPAFVLCILFFGAQAVIGPVLRQRGGTAAVVADYLATSVLLAVPDPLTYDPTSFRALVQDAAPAAVEYASPARAVLLALAYAAVFLAVSWLLYRRRPL